MVLFLGTDAQLETSEFSPEAPAFFVGSVSEHESVVHQQFSTPHVYHLGSHTMCGCGFGYGQDPEFYTWAARFPEQASLDPEEATSRRQLVEYLQALVKAGHTAEVYACWSGDEAEPPDHRSKISPEAFSDPASVRERHHLIVIDAL